MLTKEAANKLKILNVLTGKPEIIGLKMRTGDPVRCRQQISRQVTFCFEQFSSVQRQAAVCIFLGFFRIGVLAFEVDERHVQRFAASKIAIDYSAAPGG